MRKAALLALIWVTVPLFAGDSAGNGGNAIEGHLQRLLRARVLPALTHQKNDTLLDKTDVRVVAELIRQGVPIRAVDPAKLPKDRFEDLGGEIALVEEGMLIELGKPVPYRIVQDRQTRKVIAQWSVKDIPKKEDEQVLEVARIAFRFAYATSKLTQEELPEGVFFPTADQSILLPSSSYRYDIPRRLREQITRREALLASITRERLVGRRITEIVLHERNQISTARVVQGYAFKENDETWANNLDLNERVLIQTEKEVAKYIAENP